MKALALALSCGGALAALAPAQLRVVTSTPTLADLVRQIGGPHVTVQSILRGPENPHHVAAKPSFVMMLKRADLLVHTGLDAEPWIPMLIKSARRAHLRPGGKGHINAARGVELLEVPAAAELTRAAGDLHVHGNPHYLLDARNGVRVSHTIAAALTAAEPAHAADFEQSRQQLEERLLALDARLAEQMSPHRGAPLATYHRTWSYLMARYGLEKVAEVEPQPGISPWPRHLMECVTAMRAADARLVVVETYSSREDAEFVAERAGGRALTLAHEVGALPDVDSYEQLLEHNATALATALAATDKANAGGH